MGLGPGLPLESASERRVRAVRALRAVFWVAVAVSVAHYADNYLNYADYPQALVVVVARSLRTPARAAR